MAVDEAYFAHLIAEVSDLGDEPHLLDDVVADAPKVDDVAADTTALRLLDEKNVMPRFRQPVCKSRPGDAKAIDDDVHCDAMYRSNASGHRMERATRAPVRCTALLARDAKHPQDLVPVAAERHTHWAIIDLCSPVLQPDTPQSVPSYIAEVSNIIVDKDMRADLLTHLLLAGVVRR